MITADGANVSYDISGNITAAPKDASSSISLAMVYNWDEKLQRAYIGSDAIFLKHDPAGNRIFKRSIVSGQTTDRKYIVDIAGDLPTILLELETADNADYTVKKTYVYANSEILAEHDGDYKANSYFYLHDRLGSVREVINSNGAVVKMLIYSPYGETIEEQGTYYTPWQFTGQYCDSETGLYYLRARMYSPYLNRFTGRDLVSGKLEEPLTLHKYLYCGNNPINMIDAKGLLYTPYKDVFNYNESQTQNVLDFAIMWDKMGLLGAYTGHCAKGMFDYKNHGFTFDIGYGKPLRDDQFGNYIAGYAIYYDYGLPGLDAVYWAGQGFGAVDAAFGAGRWYGVSGGLGFDDWGSIYRITQGARDANHRAQDWYENPTWNPLLGPGNMYNILKDDPVQRYKEKVRTRFEGLWLDLTTQLSEGIAFAEGEL